MLTKVKTKAVTPVEVSDGTPYGDFAARYCERQEQTVEGLCEVLKAHIVRFKPEGFLLLECQILDSSYLGSLTILPYGPNNTYKTVPTHPLSPRGLASDMSIVVAVLPASAV